MCNDIEKFRNSVVDLGVSCVVMNQPQPPECTYSKDYHPLFMVPVKAYPEGFSCWDKFSLEGPCTLGEFIERVRVLHKLKVNLMLCGKTCCYNGYLPRNKHGDRLLKLIHELFEQVSHTKIVKGRRCLAIEVSCEGEEDGADYEIPVFKYTW